MNKNLHQIAIGLGMILLLTFLFFKTNVIDSDEHHKFSSGLRHLKELDATVDKDILELRYGLLNSYDLLIKERTQIKQLQEDLKNVPEFIDSDDKEEIHKLLDELSGLENKKEGLIERFKSRNAIINNSLRYFPITTSNLIQSISTKNSGRIQPEPLNNLLRDVLTYYLLTDKELEQKIADQIAKLEELETKDSNADNSEDGEDLSISISHARTILKLKPEIDGIVKETVSIPTTHQIEKIITAYNDYYQETLNRSNIYRLFLYIFSVILLIYIGFIILKLKKATSQLNAANENLEQRVRERTEELTLSHSELQKSEANNRALLYAIPDSMWRTDKNGLLLDYISDKDTSLSGPTVDWFGKTIFEILPQDVAEKTMHFAKRSLEVGEIQVFEYKVTEDDKVCYYEGRVVVCGEEETLTIVRDVTEQKLLEDQIHRGQKLESIGQLAAGIAHEINTPTQYVGDNTRFIRDAFEDIASVLQKYDELLDAARSSSVTPELIAELEQEIDDVDLEYIIEEAPNAVNQSLEGISRIAQIVQSMKDFAHPGSSDKTVADINKAIESTVTVARNEWKYLADLEMNFDNSLPPVPCLLGELNQVILNMVINASHAIADVVGDGSNGKGKIVITTTRAGEEWAEIRISDSGTGIPPEAQNRVFDPFFTTKEVGKGTGQGLAISHTVIVDKHKGKLNFETEQGKGTTFIIQLPLHSEETSI